MVNAFFVFWEKPCKARIRTKGEYTEIFNKNRVKRENSRVKQEFGPFPNTVLSKNRVKQNRVNQEQSVLPHKLLSYVTVISSLIPAGFSKTFSLRCGNYWRNY